MFICIINDQFVLIGTETHVSTRCRFIHKKYCIMGH